MNVKVCSILCQEGFVEESGVAAAVMVSTRGAINGHCGGGFLPGESEPPATGRSAKTIYIEHQPG